MLSVIIPAYNEENMIEKTNETIQHLLCQEKIDFEILFINDGSKDKTWVEIDKVCKRHSVTRGISFSRNFGKEAAIFAGMKYAKGDCCVVIDCDLQHPPETILTMYQLWKEGYEIVEGVKAYRGRESMFYRIATKGFYLAISKAVGFDMSSASDFKLLDKKVVQVLLDMPERQVFFRALSSWVGFKSTVVTFDVREREAGETKWSTGALIKYALNNISSFSAVPMQIVTVTGILFFLFSVIFGVQTLVYYGMGKSLEGFTTVILLLLIMGSILMLSIGIVGYYISKIYNEIQARPRYIVAQSLNDEVKEEQKADRDNTAEI